MEEELIEHYGCKDKKDLQDYLGDFISIEMIKSFGKLCYNQALDDASEKASCEIHDSYMEVTYNTDEEVGPYSAEINKDSILNLKLDE